MTKWLLSILGVVFLAVLLDIVYHNGKTNKFCKSIFGLFAIIVLVSPIFKIDFQKTSNDNFISTTLNKNIQSSKDEYYKFKIENALEEDDISGISVEIESNMDNNVYQIQNVLVDTSNIVLTDFLTHNNKYEVIIQKISKLMEIEQERIVIYG